MLSRFAAILRASAVCLYLASLVLVPFRTSYPNLDWWGIGILLFGWLVANPLAIFSLLRMNRYPRTCVALCLLAVLISLDSYEATRFSFGFDSRRDIIGGQHAVRTALPSQFGPLRLCLPKSVRADICEWPTVLKI
jgi:hypothetical protein